MADASAAAGQVTAPDALVALWGPSFPAPADVEAAAAAFPRWPWLHEPGPVHRLFIAPGVLRLESADLEKRYFTEQRARRRDPEISREAIVNAYWSERGEDPSYAQGPAPPSRRVLYWSDKSRSRMIRVFAELDYTPVVIPGRIPGLVTLTLPGDWLTVAPDAKAWKKLRDKFAKRWARAWGEPPTGIWKTEFQRRGAPHWHFFTSVPVGARAGELRMLGKRYRPAVGDGLLFRQWLSAVWADVVNHPDPEEYRKHLAAGTNFDAGLNFTDPKRVAVYFAKYSVSADKEYQNMPPPEWRGPGEGVGRFWGYWGLQRATVAVRVTPDERVTMARTLRRYARARGITTARKVPRGVTADGEVKFRKVRRRSGARLASCSGYLTDNDAPRLALALARLVERNGGPLCLST